MRTRNISATAIAAMCIGLWLSSTASAATADLNVQTNCGAAGNGTTDDTSSLQSCINTAATSGQAIYFPAGKYKITSPLVISTHDMTLYGTNNATTTIIQATSTANTINIENSNPSSVINRITIRGLELYYSTQNPTGISIYCKNCWRTLFRDLSFGKSAAVGEWRGWFSNGIWVVDGGIIYVEDSRFTGATSSGMIFQNVDEVNLMNLQVNNSELEESNAVGIILDGNTGGTYATNVNVTAGETGFLFQNTFGGSIAPTFGFFTHCLADAQQGTGWAFNNAKHIRLSNSWSATAGGAAGIAIGDNAVAISINDSRIINNANAGISISAGAQDVSIMNSLISGNSRTSPGVYAGVEVAAGADRFRILNNQIGAAGEFLPYPNRQVVGIRIPAGSSDNYMISNNDLQYNYLGGLYDAGTGTNKVVANNLD